MLLEGLYLPLTTPFYPDGRLYLRKLEHNVASYSKTPAAGLAVLTGIGEAGLLSDAETRAVLEAAAATASAEKVLLAGVAREGVGETLAVAKIAHELRYDAVLIRSPVFLLSAKDARRLKEVFAYFQIVADQSPLPVVLVSGRGAEHGALPTELVIEMARHGNVLGLIESEVAKSRMEELQHVIAEKNREVTVTSTFGPVTGRMLAARREASSGNYIAADTLLLGATALAVAPPVPAIKTRTKRVGFQVLASRTTTMLDGLDGDAAGAMLPLAACAPQACYEVYAAWKDGDIGLAKEKQGRLLEAAHLIEEDLGIAAIKVGCDLNGYYGGPPRLPRLPCSGEERSDIEGVMSSLRS